MSGWCSGNVAEYFSKIILKFTGPEAIMACQDDQLCAGIKAVIYSAIHGSQALWDKNWTNENWEFFFVDAKNAFNEINRVGILCTVRKIWPSGYCFRLNFYRN